MVKECLVFFLKARKTDVETLLWLETIRLFILRWIRKDATEKKDKQKLFYYCLGIR